MQVAVYPEETSQDLLIVEVPSSSNGWTCSGGYGSVRDRGILVFESSFFVGDISRWS
jgi:hypothetical protein